jgi:DNA polymerase
VDDLTALRLQIEWGADEALEDAPVDRVHRVQVHAPAALAPRPPITSGAVSSPAPSVEEGVRRALSRGVGEVGDAAVPSRAGAAERALQVAAGAATLEELRAAVAAFDGCALRDTASHLVFAAGDPAASLLVIGEPPGADDDRSGGPFAGAAGAYLDRMLGSIGLTRDALLLTPLIPWRPPGDRPPNPGELAICLPFLRRLVAIVGPARLLLLGALAARSLVPQSASRRRPRGAWMDTAEGVPALPTFSPVELMRSAKDRRAAWADLRLLRRTLDADASGG